MLVRLDLVADLKTGQIWADLAVTKSQEQMHLTYHAYDIGANGPVKYLCRVKSYFIFFPTVISWASDFLRTTYHNV